MKVTVTNRWIVAGEARIWQPGIGPVGFEFEFETCPTTTELQRRLSSDFMPDTATNLTCRKVTEVRCVDEEPFDLLPATE